MYLILMLLTNCLQQQLDSIIEKKFKDKKVFSEFELHDLWREAKFEEHKWKMMNHFVCDIAFVFC